MNKTPNYDLNQWEQTDRILMEDFNADNAKIDTALSAEQTARETAVAALNAAVAKCGNCRIVYGTYTGTGTYGSSNPNKLTFDGDPLFVVIKGSVGDAPTLGIQAMRGWNVAFSGSDNHSTVCYLTWGTHSLSWYNGQSSADQFNNKGIVYPYIALFAADE